MRQAFGSNGGTGLPVGARLVTAGDRLFTSGLTAEAPAGVEPEGRRVFAGAVALLREAGASPADVLRTRLFYVDAEAEPVLRRIHGDVFAHPGPAFSAIRVSRLPGGAQLVLELEGVRGAGATTTTTPRWRRCPPSSSPARPP